MRMIDLENWERKSHYQWFSAFADPTLGIDVKMNVTNLLDYCKSHNLSSFSLIMYVVCECINDNAAMRLRIKDNKVYEIDKANVAYTIMTNEHCFVNCRANLKNGFESYLKDINKNKEKYCSNNYVQQQYNDTSIIDDIYCSCIPWISFLSAKQPIPDKDKENKSIPRACWCKYYEENGQIFTTLNLMANHALVDGIDIADVCNSIQWAFNHISEYLEER